MTIESIAIDGFRNLHPVELTLSPQLNLFYGENAAGKTSLLEAFYVLARGRSFRTSKLDKLVQTDRDGFRLVVRMITPEGRRIPVGIERQANRLICRMDGQPVKRLSDLASLLPVHWVGANLHAVVDDGPVYRRQILDWGLFHVKPEYMETWKRFQKLLKQRNAALRQGSAQKEIQAWDAELATVGERLDAWRTEYLGQLKTELKSIHPQFPSLPGVVDIRFRKGWSDDKTYRDSLAAGISSDRESGFTRTGPHRAELKFIYDGLSAKDRLSRGQQKLFITVLKVAQATLLQKETGKYSLFLLDDLGAELDTTNQQVILQLLMSIRAQVLVTSIGQIHFEGRIPAQVKQFHVKHGRVSEVV